MPYISSHDQNALFLNPSADELLKDVGATRQGVIAAIDWKTQDIYAFKPYNYNFAHDKLCNHLYTCQEGLSADLISRLAFWKKNVDRFYYGCIQSLLFGAIVAYKDEDGDDFDFVVSEVYSPTTFEEFVHLKTDFGSDEPIPSNWNEMRRAKSRIIKAFMTERRIAAVSKLLEAARK